MHENSGTLDKDLQIISDFAAKYSLAVQIETSEIKPIIRGDNGLIYVYLESPAPLLGVAWSPDNLSSDQWSRAIRAQLHCGMQVVRDFAAESYSSFSGENPTQSALALQLAGIKPTADATVQNAVQCDVITKARQRKAKQLLHERTLKELALICKGGDLSDYDPDFVPGEYRLTI